MLTVMNFGWNLGKVVDLPEATVRVMEADGRATPYDDPQPPPAGPPDLSVDAEPLPTQSDAPPPDASHKKGKVQK